MDYYHESIISGEDAVDVTFADERVDIGWCQFGHFGAQFGRVVGEMVPPADHLVLVPSAFGPVSPAALFLLFLIARQNGQRTLSVD